MNLTRKVQITAQLILDRVGSETIYRNELGNIQIGRAIKNPLRKDQSPSMSIYIGNDGHLRHIDYADDKYRGGCIELVMQKYSISYHEALNKIAGDFQLLDDTKVYQKVESVQNKLEMPEKRHSLIQATIKKFNNKELNNYWGRYPNIGLEKLNRHNVHSIKEVYLNREKVAIGKQEMVFGYWYEGIGWKIMFPEREKQFKWLSNIPLITVEGINNLDKEHNTLVIKSKKCYMVMEDVYPYICTLQNESLGACPPEIARIITENSKKVFYGGDSDSAGKQASYRITQKYSWYHCNPQDRLLPKKDWSDWSEVEGLEPIKNHLKNKGIML